jgi:ribose/xylose/arabinose/galactoside ABC-type transport system permease subunit
MAKFVEFIKKYKTENAVSIVFVAIMLIFFIASPEVLSKYTFYTSVFTTLPIILILVISAVFVVASGEIDLSFPSVIGAAAWIFAVIVKSTGSPVLGLILAMLVGSGIGFINGILVTKVQLSSLVCTLGMNFFIRGLIMVGTQGNGIPLVFLKKSLFYNIFAGRIGNFPIQMIWGILFAVFGWYLFNRHKFGVHVCFVGDNLQSAKQTGIKIDRVKIMTFVMAGFSASFAAILISLVNFTFWPTAGDGYLLLVLAAVFLGGTPTWGGIGTIVGSVIGAFILGFLETGIIATGLTGFYTQFFYGLILILSLISHRFTGVVKRK